MKRKLFLLQSYSSMLFFDCLSVLVGEDFKQLRKQSADVYKLIKLSMDKPTANIRKSLDEISLKSKDLTEPELHKIVNDGLK